MITSSLEPDSKMKLEWAETKERPGEGRPSTWLMPSSIAGDRHGGTSFAP